jgi:hypothetical protein
MHASRPSELYRPFLSDESQHVGEVTGGHRCTKGHHATGCVEALSFDGDRSDKTVLNHSNQAFCSTGHPL